MLDKEYEDRPNMLNEFESDSSFRDILDKIVNKTQKSVMDLEHNILKRM